MKFLILFASIVAITSATRMFGYDNVRPIYEFKEWQERNTGYAKLIAQMTKSRGPFEGRIVGGQEATPNQFPFQVALLSPFEEGVGLCGGTIIAADFIMTAAHCVTADLNVTIIVAAHNRLAEEQHQFRVWSENVIMHPQWDPSLIRNDIALIRLNTPLTFTPQVQPVLLPRVSQLGNNFEGELATASGWGRFTDSQPQASPVLNFIHVPVVDNPTCNRWFLGLIHATNICAEQSVCHGDSGGPLTIVDEHGETIEVGIASFVIALGCERGWPTAFVRVTSYHDWIHSNTGSSLLPRP